MATKVSGISSGWRRQIAAVRIANAYFTFAGTAYFVFISAQVAVLSYDVGRLRSERALLGFDPRWPLFAGLSVIALPAMYYFLQGMLRPELPSARLRELDEFGLKTLPQIRSRIGLSPSRTVELRILTRGGPPVSVSHRRKKVIVRLHPDIVALVLLKPKALGALLAHELTHSLQWDTSIGYIWYIVSIAACFVLAVPDTILLAVAAGIAWRQGILESLPYFEVSLLGALYTLGLAAFCFLIRRWMEYSADISAVLTGYGSQMIMLLSTHRTSKKRPWLRRILSAYPTPEERLVRLEKIVGIQNEMINLSVDECFENLGPNCTRIRLRDYGHAFLFSIIPTCAPMAVFAFVFIRVSEQLGKLPSEF